MYKIYPKKSLLYISLLFFILSIMFFFGGIFVKFSSGGVIYEPNSIQDVLSKLFLFLLSTFYLISGIIGILFFKNRYIKIVHNEIIFNSWMGKKTVLTNEKTKIFHYNFKFTIIYKENKICEFGNQNNGSIDEFLFEAKKAGFNIVDKRTK